MALTFADIVRKEPRLQSVEAAVAAAAANGSCWVAVWDDIVKPMIRPLVGYYRAPLDDLSESSAWDCVANYFERNFPDCVRRCSSCGLPVAPSDTFTGRHPKSGTASLVDSLGSYQNGPCNSWLAVVDMLGYTRAVLEAECADAVEQHLRSLEHVLDNAYRYLKSDADAHRPWALKLYSDNAALGVEVWDDGESESARIFESLAFFQLAAVFNGQFVRGGLSVGTAFFSPDVIYGKSLIDAHAMEKIASVPRVILSEEARRLLAHHASYFDRWGVSLDRLAELPILEDDDGHWFVDYLSVISGRLRYQSLDVVAMARHRDIVTAALEKYKYDERIAAKYRWVAGYHNWVCDQINEPNLAILMSTTLPSPKGEISPEARQKALAEFRARHAGVGWPQVHEAVAIANKRQNAGET